MLTRGARYDRDAAGHRFPADGRRLHPPLPESQEVRSDGNLQTVGSVFPVQAAEPRHVSELQGPILFVILSLRIVLVWQRRNTHVPTCSTHRWEYYIIYHIVFTVVFSCAQIRNSEI